MKQKIDTKKLKKSALADALAALLPGGALFAPAGEAERQAFSKIETGSIDSINLRGLPVISPKELLFPRSETLYGVGLVSGEIAEPESPGKTVLFGVRPCDARAIANLDSAFLEQGYTDSAYAQRREATTIIALACPEIASPSCFCDSMGGSPASPEGADVLLRETADGEAWLVSFLSEKGKAVEALWQEAGVLDEPDAEPSAAPANAPDVKPAAEADSKPAEPPACTLKVEKPADLAGRLIAAFDDPIWARFSEACIGCGTCSYICPTCYCFDIDSETSGAVSEQFRCWDCCMFSDYSRMAGGHNPRPTKKERLRNRYLHKLAYFDERYEKTLCVGCGRCISKCPAALDIADIIEWGGQLCVKKEEGGRLL